MDKERLRDGMKLLAECYLASTDQGKSTVKGGSPSAVNRTECGPCFHSVPEMGFLLSKDQKPNLSGPTAAISIKGTMLISISSTLTGNGKFAFVISLTLNASRDPIMSDIVTSPSLLTYIESCSTV